MFAFFKVVSTLWWPVLELKSYIINKLWLLFPSELIHKMYISSTCGFKFFCLSPSFSPGFVRVAVLACFLSSTQLSHHSSYVLNLSPLPCHIRLLFHLSHLLNALFTLFSFSKFSTYLLVCCHTNCWTATQRCNMSFLCWLFQPCGDFWLITELMYVFLVTGSWIVFSSENAL